MKSLEIPTVVLTLSEFSRHLRILAAVAKGWRVVSSEPGQRRPGGGSSAHYRLTNDEREPG
jgi:hypothetical protein